MMTRLMIAIWLSGAALSFGGRESWKNTEGKEIQAELSGVEDDKAVFVLKNGKTVKYPLAKLDEDANKRIAEFQKLVEFLENAPETVDTNRKLITSDKTYGVTKENPVLVGSSKKNAQVFAEEEYLEKLLDSKGEYVRYQRLGPSGKAEDGHDLILYQISGSDGSEIRLYIDSNHPENDPDQQPAPVGFWRAKHPPKVEG